RTHTRRSRPQGSSPGAPMRCGSPCARSCSFRGRSEVRAPRKTTPRPEEIRPGHRERLRVARPRRAWLERVAEEQQRFRGAEEHEAGFDPDGMLALHGQLNAKQELEGRRRPATDVDAEFAFPARMGNPNAGAAEGHDLMA